MPDRDVFDRNVRRGWKHAARLIIGHDEDPGLYRTHVREFDALVTKIDRPGWRRQASITELPPVAGIVAFG